MKNSKDELKQYQYIQNRAETLLEEYEKYKTRATKMTSLITGMPHGSGCGDKVGDNACKMAEISEEWQKEWQKAEKIRLEIFRKINLVEEPYATVLRKRYLDIKGFEAIAYELHRSYDYVLHIHGEALKKYQEIN